MSKTPHAATRAPQQAEGPKATLPQLGELVAQMNKGQIDRDYMQDFLRRRLVRPGRIQAVQPLPQPAPNALLAAIEEIAREHYPHAVNEILEVVAPFCDPALDLEFKPFTRGDHDKVREALFWLGVGKIEVVSLLARLSGQIQMGMAGTKCKGFSNRVYREMFADVFRTYNLLNTVSEEGAREIMCSLRSHPHARFDATGAVKYGLVGNSSAEEDIVGSILSALQKAILFAATGDKARLEKVVNFLTFQRSGHPVYHWHEGTAYVLALREEK